MNRIINSQNTSDKEEQKVSSKVDRRSFLMSAGIAASVGAAMVACSKDHEPTPGTGTTVNLGAGDVGVLNYAYALEQLEAAFYIQVIDTPYDNMSAEEKTILTDIRDHEVIHRDFFKAALTAAAPSQIIPGLTPDFSTVDFKSRTSVLGTAKVFEDTGVAAYNGAGNLIKTADYLVLAGKIVSVEARHASVIRDLINKNTADFAGDDVVDTSGLDKAIDPATILAAVQKYIKNPINGSNVGK
ncbi:ferritin-like domain-containing protein [Dyadobacter psychrotolerans]|uniref:Ferritin-like domain-containing protein n=1 Tax=Dyadobacter psychrotolerans TaxID=2541721 RepID=A0A4R5DFK1_9BACT|nr:ferritin-like domain-containing protein [Dyadobacter psychrotolerans]TDE12742.1 ferritin-like domain-containing protein [Dyadobacter psychrotolerans]